MGKTYYFLKKITVGGCIHYVWRVKDLERNELIAKEIMKKSEDSFKSELMVSKKLQYKNKPIYIADGESQDCFILIKNFIKGVDPRKILFFEKDSKVRLKIAQSIINALQYFHANGFCHNDALPGNSIYDPDDGTSFFVDYETSEEYAGNKVLLDYDYIRLYFGVKIRKGICHFLQPSDRKKLYNYDKFLEIYMHSQKKNER